MKRNVLLLCLGFFLLNNIFAIDLNKFGQLFDKSMDIAISELDNLKDFDIPKAEDVEAKVNNEMYISELESKVAQLEAEVRLLKREKDKLEEAYDRVNSENNNLRFLNMMSDDAFEGYEKILEDRELEIQVLEKENNRLKELLKRKIKKE